MGKKIRIVILIAVLASLIGSVFLLFALNSPPKYEDISRRFIELTEGSYEANVVLFGEGLPTYERVYDPSSRLSVHKTGEKYTDGNGTERERIIYYYKTLEESREVYAFRDSSQKSFSYNYTAIYNSEPSQEQLSADFPPIDGAAPPQGREFYSEVYRKDGSIGYLVPYAEAKKEFYYSQEDDPSYDYVRNDSKFKTVEEIKALAEGVYSKKYAQSLYGPMFDGMAEGGLVAKAKYMQKTEGKMSGTLMQSNEYEALFSERRVYIYDTAKIIKIGSNKKFVRIEVESYLPSDPEKITTAEIDLEMQNGEWYLATATY